MFIRQTRTNNKATGEGYFTFRLVRTERIGGRVRQLTLLNLGRHFPVKQDDWPLLCARIDQLLQPQATLAPLVCPDGIEHTAVRLFAQLVARAPAQAECATASAASGDADAMQPVRPSPPPEPDFQEVDIDSLQQSTPRSVGVEHVALHAMAHIGFVAMLESLGINGAMRAAILANVIGRMAHPASERATWQWLLSESALGELLDVDYSGFSAMRLYRASDLLMAHRETIESRVFGAVQTVFSLEETVTLYDLTNTYFEGEAAANGKAKHGRSKEKRSDCPLVTLGLVLDGSGFVRRSQTFAGNISEGTTLATMVSGLMAPPGALVIMDAGIATEANLAWLVSQGYRYLVVRRGGAREFDATQSVAVETARGDLLRVQRALSADGTEVLLHCHSPGREAKEMAMVSRFTAAFEAGLQKIQSALATPRGEKRPEKVQERLGRLKEKSHGVSQHYTVTLTLDKAGKTVTGLTWEKQAVAGTMATHPGVYCLRSNELSWDAERLWRTYTMLTDLESVFRSLKGELGLRPVFHAKEVRTDGHLFITVLAYQLVQVIRRQLQAAGITDSWATLRQTLSVQRRVTASMRRKDGRVVHVRKATVAEPALQAIYGALGVSAMPGGTKKLVS